MNPAEQLCQQLTSNQLDYRVKVTMDYAKSNLRTELTLPRLAKLSNVSTWHLCRLFKAQLGLSPSRCIKLLRVKCAADLLVDTLLTVKGGFERGRRKR
jgi:transcriptional regulator GlxA family with amidase domain